MNQSLKNLIKKLVQEYGTGAGGRNHPKGGGNLQTSPRIGGSFRDDEEEMMDYILKNVYGGDGGHYVHEPATKGTLNRDPRGGMFELKKYIKKILEELDEQAYGSATLTTQGPPRTGAIAYTDEYPYSVRPKRTATGMYEQTNPYQTQIDNNNRKVQQLQRNIQNLQLKNSELSIKAASAASQKAGGQATSAIAKIDKQIAKLVNEKDQIEVFIAEIQAEINQQFPSDITDYTPEQVKSKEAKEQELKKWRDRKDKIDEELPNLTNQKNQTIKQSSMAAAQAATSITQQRKAFRQQRQQMKKQQANIQELYKNYFNNRKNKNLMEYIDSYKREILFEGAMHKFFTLFDEGKSNEEILRIFAEQGVVVPEQFIGKARKKHESLKHDKLDLEELERETKNFKKISLVDEEPNEKKQLASSLFKEGKIKDRYPIPSEIKYALENDLEMYPLIRFVKNLKAVNSIPPSYRIFLINNQYFDIIYEEYSLKLKIKTEEYYLGDLDDRNYAKKHINKLMTEPILKVGDDEDIDTDTPPPAGGGGEDTPTGRPPAPESPTTPTDLDAEA